jgi:hypothetical protein
MKLPKITLMILYLASLAYGIFLTDTFRLPAPLVFCIPLVFFYKEAESRFQYTREVAYLCIAIFLYEVVGLNTINSFFAMVITIIVCALYFSFYINGNARRFIWSVWIFYALLFISSIVMVANHWYPQINSLRAIVLGSPVLQSPAGLSPTQFGSGYQLAALAPFLLINAFVFKRNLFIKAVVFLICLIFVFLGLQRSAFVGFVVAVLLFLTLYYGFRAILLVGLMSLLCVFLISLSGQGKMIGTDNILNKNEHNDDASNRSDLARENLRIYAQYPFGLIFYGKDWGDVIYRNYVFSAGITSHNAYLMFITYLGPFLGLSLLAAIYLPLGKIVLKSLKGRHAPGQPLMLCLIFSFVSVSVNALSHNPWLFSADGPTIFSFFAILHCHQLQKKDIGEQTTFQSLSYA